MAETIVNRGCGACWGGGSSKNHPQISRTRRKIVVVPEQHHLKVRAVIFFKSFFHWDSNSRASSAHFACNWNRSDADIDKLAALSHETSATDAAMLVSIGAALHMVRIVIPVIDCLDDERTIGWLYMVWRAASKYQPRCSIHNNERRNAGMRASGWCGGRGCRGHNRGRRRQHSDPRIEARLSTRSASSSVRPVS